MIISKLQQRDLIHLAELYPDNDFESDYLEHLQDLRHMLVAYHKDDEGLRTYFGYVMLRWESTYTPFWRHNIPEIINIYVAEAHRRQGIGAELIKAIEGATAKKGYSKIGVRFEPVGELVAAQNLFHGLAYSADSFGSKDAKQLSLVKTLA